MTTLTTDQLHRENEALRRRPIDGFPWDGVGDVRPFGASEKKIIEGVY